MSREDCMCKAGRDRSDLLVWKCWWLTEMRPKRDGRSSEVNIGVKPAAKSIQ